ncbi:MAG TPA: hypothetical protein VFO53_05250, partial [Casimicrobiaceae bacterium]|nr:hypothetical protein [Casimicrobiaceae bacterium]
MCGLPSDVVGEIHQAVEGSAGRRFRSRANKVGDAAIPAGQGSPLLGHADIRITSRHDAHLRCRTLANAVNA